MKIIFPPLFVAKFRGRGKMEQRGALTFLPRAMTPKLIGLYVYVQWNLNNASIKDITITSPGGGGAHSTMDSILALIPAAPGLVLGIPKIFLEKFEFLGVLEIDQQQCTA